MNTLNGYAKSTLTNDYLLTAAGGHKSLSDFLLKNGGTMTGSLTVPSISVTGAATFSLAINGSILGNAATASRLANPRTISLTGSASGSTTFDGSANVSLSARISRLNNNSEMTYGWDGVNYFNIEAANLSAAKVNDTPFSSATWTHILRFNHVNTNGYYTDLAIPFNANGVYYKRIQNGYLQNDSINGGWVKLIDLTDTSVLKTNGSVTATGMINLLANLYTEATTLAETLAALNLNNSNIKGVNGIYFSDISNEINEGIHFVRSGNNVDTLTSYEGTLYYRTNRALGTTKSDTPTLSSNIILHNKNISNYQRYHNIYYTTSSNGTAGTNSITSTLNGSTYTGYVNGYWLGNLDYVGAMCTSDMANASNTGKYNFVKTGDADTFIYDSSTTVQLIIGSRGTNEIIDIYNLQGATLRIFVVNTYNDTRCSVYVIDGDTRTIFDGEDYSTSIAGNVKYWKYGSASYTRLTGISTYFLSNTRGILRVIWESGGKIFLIKCSAFPN